MKPIVDVPITGEPIRLGQFLKLAGIAEDGTHAKDLLDADEVTVNSLHPATYMPTKIVLDEVGHSIDSLDEGVDATRRLVSDPALAQVTGRFFDRAREARANAQAYDARARAELWNRSLQLTGQTEPA